MGFGPVVKAVLYKPIANKDKSAIIKILKSTEKYFRKIALTFLIYIIVLCLILPQILSKEFNGLFTVSLIIIIAISTFAEYYFGMIYNLYLQAKQKLYIISIIKIGTLLLNTLLIIILIRLGASIHIIKSVPALIFVLRPILQYICVRKKCNINIKKQKEIMK